MDNTFLSPLGFRPLERGVDISIESATKFLGGHSDLMAGTVAVKDGTLAKRIYFVQNGTGNMLSPENSWLLIRGIKTLAARLRMQTEAAAHLAHGLQNVPWIEQVYYPGLPTHPGHAIMMAQCDSFGSVLSIETGSAERAKRIMERVTLWNVAVSLGGVESILSYPARMSHAAMPASTRAALGITDGLLRLSPGLEAAEDLLHDLISAGGDA
jgi:cystathionine beta-lyase/cystathionine gamma-synthase